MWVEESLGCPARSVEHWQETGWWNCRLEILGADKKQFLSKPPHQNIERNSFNTNLLAYSSRTLFMGALKLIYQYFMVSFTWSRPSWRLVWLCTPCPVRMPRKEILVQEVCVLYNLDIIKKIAVGVLNDTSWYFKSIRMKLSGVYDSK